MRDHCNAEELEAHRILDMVKAGLIVPEVAVIRALFVLGDAMSWVDV